MARLPLLRKFFQQLAEFASHPPAKNADVPRITDKPFTWMLHDSWTDGPEMVVIQSGQNIHPSAGGHVDLTQTPLFTAPPWAAASPSPATGPR